MADFSCGGIACCGLDELANIRGTDPAEWFKQFQKTDGKLWPFVHVANVVFTDINQPLSGHVDRPPFYWGDLWKTYIQKNKLGTVKTNRPRRNPNSGNMVKAYLWTPAARLIERYEDVDDGGGYC